ncbi:MAG: efflux RND transporter permease subunit [Crocinitomicaceae bacterium]|nr:efflux RND transporter permease subunit [Crocinitomicaceae bacterium]
MKNLIRFFIKNHIWANALIVVTLIFGVYSVLTMKQSFFPEMDPATVLVNVAYPGASPSEMEEGVTIKVEQALRGIDGIEEITSTSTENFANIKVKGFDDADMDEVFKDIDNAVSSINSFPAGAEKPTIQRIKSNVMSELVSILRLSGDCDLRTLKDEADKIENDLYSSGLISNIDLIGFPEMEIVIEVRESDLLKYNMLIDEISLAVQRTNQDLTGGILKDEKEELIIRSRQRSTDPRDIENIEVRVLPTGEIVRVKDVANVKIDFAESSQEVYYGGNRAINIFVKKTIDQDMAAITEFARNYVKEYNEGNHPAELALQYEFAKSLEDRISLLTNNGIVGLILVLIVLGLFLSTRLSGWVAFGIPFSFLGMFIITGLLGFTINMISLFGMILVVGILVDDGIVIAENIFAHFERGKSPFKAAFDGTLEVMPSVFTSVLTTIAAFSILLFVEGMEMMSEMAVVVIVALGFSLIEAFIILPVHLASKKVLSRSKEGTLRYKLRSKFTQGVDYIRDKVFADVLVFVMDRYRAYVLLPLIFTIFIIVFSFSGIIKYTFFPEIKPDRVQVEVAFKPGTSKEITKGWVDEAEKIILETNAEVAVMTGDTLLGDYSITLGSSQNLGEAGFHTASFALTIDGEGKATPVDTLNNRIIDKLYQLTSTKLAEKVYVGGSFNTFGKPVEFSLSGTDDEEVRMAKEVFKGYLSNMPQIFNLKDNEPLGRKEINLEMKPEANFQGLGVFEVTKQVRQGVFGQEVQRVIVGTEEVKLWVRYAKEDRENQEDLRNMRIKTAQGKEVLLTEIADYTIERGPISLKRRDGKREVVVDAAVYDPKEVGTVNADIVNDVIPKLKAEFPGVEVVQRGQGERSADALMSMQINTMILMTIMVLIMSLNFQSVFQALLILLVIPAGVASGILGHSLVGIPVSVLSAFGMIALIGILINDAIVFLDTYNRNLLEGKDVKEAVLEAAKSRFRPILLTSITTVAGLLPLIMETSFQAQFLIPMAVSIAFGILFGTFFILVFFPTIILLHADMRRAAKYISISKDSELLSDEKGAQGWIGYIIYYLVAGIAFLSGVAIIAFEALGGASLIIGIILSSIALSTYFLKRTEIAKLFKLQLSSYLYLFSVLITVKGMDLLLAEDGPHYIGLVPLTIGILVIAVLPKKLFNRIISWLWRNDTLPKGREVEPAILNEKERNERDV